MLRRVLFQAVARVGAVLAPCMTTIRPRELELMLRRVEASVCITVDRWAGFDHAEALRDMAFRLPTLRHRVVLGAAGEGDIEFAPLFEEAPWEQRHPVALDDAREDPDAFSVVLFTSGTSGEPKAALHTENTLFCNTAGVCKIMAIEPSDVFFSPHALIHSAAQASGRAALQTGASIVLLASWSGARGLEVMAESGTTRLVIAAPVYINELI